MTMQEVLLSIGGIMLTAIGYFLRQLVDQLKALNKTVNDIKIEIGVLANDHDNLKDRVVDIDERVRILER